MKRIINIGISLTLLITAIFIIGPACSGGLTVTWVYLYEDVDGDGYGAGEAVAFNDDDTIPINFIEDNTDCDDSNADVYPGATEIPNNLIDEDCNGQIAITFYVDQDEDGFGNPNSSNVIEIDSYDSDAPNGYSWVAGDCNDDNAFINPKADEIPENGIDDNCDGEVDVFERYVDSDGDGYGSSILAAAEGVMNNFDCDDSNTEIHPFTKEILDNGIDDDCDNAVDEIN